MYDEMLFVVDNSGRRAWRLIGKNFKNTPQARPSIQNRFTNLLLKV